MFNFENPSYKKIENKEFTLRFITVRVLLEKTI